MRISYSRSKFSSRQQASTPASLRRLKHLPLALLLGLAAARPALAAVPPTVPASLDVLGMRLTLDEDARQLVQAKVNSLCRHQASLDERIALAEAALPLIDQVLEQEGLPTDFRYLVLQESALHGDAESAHGAVGYWQLKRETALGLGLVVNDQLDERRHLTASTRAAARYLTRNNASLHNWANALLSYNLGPGGARPYVRPEDDGATSMAFTGSTNPYLLDFVAQKLVFEPACAAAAVPFVPWREVRATPGQSLSQHAAALGTDPATLTRLNPWLLTSAVPQDGRTYTLLVPLALPVAAASRPTDSDDDEELARVRNLPTEVPGLPVQELPTARPAAPTPSPASRRPVVLAPVPVRPVVTVATPTRPAAAPALYVVAPRETLYSLARRQGVRPADLAAWNGLAPTASLHIGQLLRLGPLAPNTAAPQATNGTYVVATGDTFYSIARRYRCSVGELQSHNDRATLALQVGEVLRVPRY